MNNKINVTNSYINKCQDSYLENFDTNKEYSVNLGYESLHIGNFIIFITNPLLIDLQKLEIEQMKDRVF